MKYFIDQEFFEGFYKPFLGRRRHFIDLISIGIVAEDGKEYYAISNEFDIKTVWNKWQKSECCQMPEMCGAKKMGNCPGYQKDYWLRNNVLKPIWKELSYEEYREGPKSEFLELIDTQPEWERTAFFSKYILGYDGEDFSLNNFKRLIKKYGKSNNQIKQEIFHFVCPTSVVSDYAGMGSLEDGIKTYLAKHPPEFYGYYADYDWVLFCSLFGRMIDLPKGFPMYCRDLKQTFDEAENKWAGKTHPELIPNSIKEFDNYPKQTNEHNALADARWNFQLFRFLNSL